jgi:hypothetical protein
VRFIYKESPINIIQGCDRCSLQESRTLWAKLKGFKMLKNTSGLCVFRG